MNTNFERLTTGLIVAAAIAVAVANIHREFSRPAPILESAVAAPTYEKNWRDVLSAGTVIGDSSAPVKVVEFADLECPGCRAFYTRTRELPPSIRSRFALIFIHFPLSMHRFAMPAARAAECARVEDKFASMVDVLFKKQDSLGLKSWGSYATEAGVRDTTAFARCVTNSSSLRIVDAGLASGKNIGVRATPTVIINGWRFSSPPYDSLAALVTRFADGARP